jgi:hypothetical protein
MQPSVTDCVCAERQQRITRSLTTAAAQASSRYGRRWVSVEPFRHAAGKRACFSLGSRQPTVKLGDGGALVEEDLPILGRPISSAEQPQDVGFVSRQEIEHSRTRWRGRFEFQVFAIETHADSNDTCRL